jgi:predicted RNA-binding protein Jag
VLTAISKYERNKMNLIQADAKRKEMEEKQEDFFSEFDERTIKDYVQSLSDEIGGYIIEKYELSWVVTFNEFNLKKPYYYKLGEFVEISSDWLSELNDLIKLVKNVKLESSVSFDSDYLKFIIYRKSDPPKTIRKPTERSLYT